jgi:hypothetical protein
VSRNSPGMSPFWETFCRKCRNWGRSAAKLEDTPECVGSVVEVSECHRQSRSVSESVQRDVSTLRFSRRFWQHRNIHYISMAPRPSKCSDFPRVFKFSLLKPPKDIRECISVSFSYKTVTKICAWSDETGLHIWSNNKVD